MLQFIYGAAGSGKSNWVMNSIAEAVKTKEKIMLLVPEQFSFESERNLLSLLGEHGFSHVEVYSFTRMCHHFFELYGGNTRRYADETSKIMLMDLAIHEISDMLQHYHRASRTRTFLNSALQTVEELKLNGITPELYDEATVLLAPEKQGQKLKEISNIYAVYQGYLDRSYEDALDDFAKALEQVKEHRAFDGYTIFLDEFKGFTKPEFDLVEQMLIQADCCYVTLCMDYLEKNEPLFSCVQQTASRLTAMADKHGIVQKKAKLLEKTVRFQTQELSHVERNVFRCSPEIFDGENSGSIELYLAENEYEEVDYVLSGIWKLVREKGMRFRDIVIMARNLNVYQNILESSFQKYNIPFFMDSRFELEKFPSTRFLEILLQLSSGSFDTDRILDLFKCGLFPFSLEEVSALENYTFLWGITGTKWSTEFSANPRGFKGALTAEDEKILQQLNQMRSFVIDPLEQFRNRISRASVKQMCQAFYHLLEDYKVPDTLSMQINELNRSGKQDEAEDHARVWESLMTVLDTMVTAAGDSFVEPARFAELFSLAVQKSDLADRPQVLDCVMVGSPERMRTDSPKALFLLGVNEGFFPLVPQDSGLLCYDERVLLHNAGLELEGDFKRKFLEERFISYKALSVPTDILVLTARSANLSGEVQPVSEIFQQLTMMFGNDILKNMPSESTYFCPTKETAFLKLASGYARPSVFIKTLETLFLNDEEYSGKVDMLNRALYPQAFSLKNEELSQKLFGNQMYLSPSKIEAYYRCHFAYFCRYGLKAYPREKAEFNPMERGMVIHDLLYRFVSERGDEMYEMSKDEITKAVSEYLYDYIERVMGGKEDKSRRFLALFYRLRSTLVQIVLRLISEFKQSRFQPVDFELEIGKSENVAPMIFDRLDGTKVMVSGTIDRVDLCEIDGQKYARVVDYKSGVKKFKLSDVYYGLNLQMILYLFTLWKNGKNKYADVLPAGVLYMPAGEASPALGRDASEEEIQRQRLAQYKMNGFVLEDDEVVQAMEHDVKGVFIPVERNKDGSFSKRSSLLRLEELGKLEGYVTRLILKMADELYHGNIEAKPVFGKGSKQPCEYCDYRDVCGSFGRETFRPADDISHDEFFELIGGDENAGV